MNIEFFTTSGNLTPHLLNLKMDGEYHGFPDLDDNEIEIIFTDLLGDPRAVEKLKIIQSLGITDKRAMIRQFALCNWAKLDRIQDVDDQHHLNFEYVQCGFKKSGCPFGRQLCIKKTRTSS